MRIRNLNPIGEVEVPSLGRVVAAGETVEVSDEVGAALLDQPMNWAPADPAPTAPTSKEK